MVNLWFYSMVYLKINSMVYLQSYSMVYHRINSMVLLTINSMVLLIVKKFTIADRLFYILPRTPPPRTSRTFAPFHEISRDFTKFHEICLNIAIIDENWTKINKNRKNRQILDNFEPFLPWNWFPLHGIFKAFWPLVLRHFFPHQPHLQPFSSLFLPDI